MSLHGSSRSPELAKVDRSAFRFEAKKPAARIAIRAAGHLFAIHPQPHFAIDAANVVMVPLANSLAEILAREAAVAIGAVGGKGFIVEVPTGKTSPLVVNQSAFLPVCFSYCSVKPWSST